MNIRPAGTSQGVTACSVSEATLHVDRARCMHAFYAQACILHVQLRMEEGDMDKFGGLHVLRVLGVSVP